MTQEYADLIAHCLDWICWNPQSALLQSDPQEGKLLPIPFSGRELAAFLLCPVAHEVTDRFGNPGALNSQVLTDYFGGVRDGMCRRAVEDAYAHLKRASDVVGPQNSELFGQVKELESTYEQARDLARERLGIACVSGHGRTDAEYSKRITEANEEVRELKGAVTAARAQASADLQDWLCRMTRTLFDQTNSECFHVAASADSNTNEQGTANEFVWTVRKPQRFFGYGNPLYRLLEAARRGGTACPTARDVVEAWRESQPAEIAKVLTDSIDYYDSHGNTKAANLDAIRKAIRRMTSDR